MLIYSLYLFYTQKYICGSIGIISSLFTLLSTSEIHFTYIIEYILCLYKIDKSFKLKIYYDL